MSTMYRLALVLLLLGATTPTPAAPRTVEVRLVNFRFEPNVVTIQLGDTVRFFNQEGVHDVRADDGSFSRPPEPAPWIFERTFFQAGEVLFRCSVHSPIMNGRITVVDIPPTTTTTTLPPTTTTTTLPPPTTTTWPPTPPTTTLPPPPPTTTLPPTPTTTTTLPPTPPPRADLELSLMDTPDLLTVNGQLTYTITVTNNGPGTATGVQVGDSLPPGAEGRGPASSSQGACNSAVTVVCDLETLAAGARATVTINVTPKVTGDLSNTATVTAFETDLNSANNSSTETTTVQPSDPARADLAVTAEAAVGPTRASGQGFTYTLTVTNDGPATATGVQLTNDLPRGIALGPVTASQVTYNCSDTDPMLCSLGALPTGEEATVAIDVIRTEGVGTLPNQATVNGEQTDPDRNNNVALTSAIDLPTPQTTCNSKRCSLTLTCNVSDLLERRCDNQVTLFVDSRARRDTRARRLSDERAARLPSLVRFASTIRNFPGGQTKNVRLKLTSKGKGVGCRLTQQGKKKLRGELRISNAASGIDIIPLTVRLEGRAPPDCRRNGKAG